MKQFLAIPLAALTGFAALSFPAPAQEEEAAAPIEETIEIGPSTGIHERRLDLIEDYLNSIETLKADFVQQAPDGSLTRGVMHLQKPGRVRFEYAEGVPILVVADGENVNLIDYEVGQVTRWPVNDTPLRLILQRDIELDRDLAIVSAGPGELANMLSLTVRDPDRPGEGTMTMIFSLEEAAGTPQLALRLWQVKDAQGGLTTVSLNNLETNQDLSRELWTFDDPRGERFRRRNRR